MAAVNALSVEIRRKSYPGMVLFDGFRLTLPAGGFTALVGPSGCGKSTLLNMVAGLDRDFDGAVRLPAGRGGDPVLGYVFQNPRLLPWYTVAENLALVLRHRPGWPALAAAWLRDVGLEGQGGAYPARLSGGMARRAALARAFAVEPDLLLMDEPFVSLDAITARRLRALLAGILRAHPTTVLFVTHDVREAVALADRILFLSPSPVRVLLDLPVGLSAEERADEDAVERLCRDLRRTHGALLEGGG